MRKIADPAKPGLARRSFFDEHAEHWMEMWYKDPQTGAYTRFTEQFRRLIKLLALVENDRVLDLGCGSGVLVPYLLDGIGAHGRIFEVDYAPKMIAANRRRHRDRRIRFIVGDVAELRLPAESCDVAVCFSCFPHFDRKQEALAAISAIIRRGGRLAIAHFDSAEAINNHHRKHMAVRHDRLPSERAMRKLVLNAGLQVERLINEPGFYYLGAIKPAV